MGELALNRAPVGVDIGMVKFKVVQNRQVRCVVDKLGALVEKGGVVFIRLNHEILTRAEPRRLAEITRPPAD